VEVSEIKQRFEQLAKKWGRFFEILQTKRLSKESIAGFGDIRAKQLLDEFWDILQLILNDIVVEMEKQGFDTTKNIPPQVWKVVKPKIDPVFTLYQRDITNCCDKYSVDFSNLNKEIYEELALIKNLTDSGLLDIFNDALKDD